jgi:hypothetical protein
MEPEDNNIALPEPYVVQLIDWLVGHGFTKVADELADHLSGDAPITHESMAVTA